MAGTRTTRGSVKRSSTTTDEEASENVAPETTPKTPKKTARGRPAKKVKSEDDEDIKPDPSPRKTPTKKAKGVKKEEADDEKIVGKSPSKTLAERKLQSHRSSANKTPFPRWSLPHHSEAEKVAWILGRWHGYKPESEGGRGLPKFTPPKGEDKWGGCGDVKDVLEATVRTILSCNTSGNNSANAHQGLVKRFGRRDWKAIAEADQKEVEEAIRCGGLAVNKSKNIQALLRDTHARFGSYSLQHLHGLPSEEIMEILLSFSGVGPKVASCVSAFCLARPSLAIDTHVNRLSIALGWVPPKSTREQTYYHLNVRVQEELRYPLHVLLIQHGKRCSNCRAKGGGGGAKKPKEETPSGDEAEEEEKEKFSNKECPLKANELLSRRDLKLLPEGVEIEDYVKGEQEDDKGKVKKEEA